MIQYNNIFINLTLDFYKIIEKFIENTNCRNINCKYYYEPYKNFYDYVINFFNFLKYLHNIVEIKNYTGAKNVYKSFFCYKNVFENEVMIKNVVFYYNRTLNEKRAHNGNKILVINKELFTKDDIHRKELPVLSKNLCQCGSMYLCKFYYCGERCGHKIKNAHNLISTVTEYENFTSRFMMNDEKDYFVDNHYTNINDGKFYLDEQIKFINKEFELLKKLYDNSEDVLFLILLKFLFFLKYNSTSKNEFIFFFLFYKNDFIFTEHKNLCLKFDQNLHISSKMLGIIILLSTF